MSVPDQAPSVAAPDAVRSSLPVPAATEAAATEAAAARAWRGMRHLVLERYDRRREVCHLLGMSFIRVKALRLLASGPMTMRELAAKLPADAPYTTLIAGDLERRGMVTRSVHSADRRSKIVAITPEGARAAEQAGQILGAPPAALCGLGPDDLAALDRVVAELVAGDGPA
jgi:DNA-binding MarR family transcriptional regulator